MGGEAVMSAAPRFEVRATGSLEQLPGCPADRAGALGPDAVQELCSGECYNPGETRRRITRVEVVRILPRRTADERVADLVEDPWRVLPCPAGAAGCRVQFSDPEFAGAGRDAIYYVRAIEEPSPAVNGGDLRCERDGQGQCLAINPCDVVDPADDCLAPVEQRAWSSPIFVDFGA